MIRRTVLPVVLAALLAALATPALAAEGVLGAIPENALAFSVFNRLGRIDAKIDKLAGELELPAPGVLAILKTAAGVKEGLDEKGSAAMVLMPPEEEDGDPVLLLLVPVTDFGRFIAPLEPEDAEAKIVKVTIFDGPFLAARRGSYAVLAELGQEALLEKVLGAKKSAAEELKPLAAWLDANDVAGVVPRKGVEFFCDKALQEVRKSKSEFADMPDEGKDMVGGMVAMMEIYEKIMEAARKEIVVLAGGARVDEQGNVRLAGRMRLLAGGEAARALAALKPPEAKALAQLPAQPFVAAFAGNMPEPLAEAMMQLSTQMMKSGFMPFGSSGEDSKKLMEMSVETMKGVRGMSFMLGVGKEKEPLYSSMVFVVQVDDARAYLQKYEKLVKAMAGMGKEGKPSILGGVKAEKTRVGDVDGLKISMGIPLPPGMADVPQFKEMMEKMMEKMYGPGGKIVTYLAPADEHTVVGGYTSTETVIRAIRTVKQGQEGLAGDRQVAKTAAMLPAGAPWVVYWSPQGTVDFARRMVALFAEIGAGAGAPEIPEFPQTPAVGAVIIKAPDEVRLEAVVPAETLKAGAAYILKLQQGVPGF